MGYLSGALLFSRLGSPPPLPVRIADQDGNPWFVAKDVCDILGFRDVFNGTRGLDDDEKDTLNVSTPGGIQEMIIINESDLYSLILRSRKLEAKSSRSGWPVMCCRRTISTAAPARKPKHKQ